MNKQSDNTRRQQKAQKNTDKDSNLTFLTNLDWKYDQEKIKPMQKFIQQLTLTIQKLTPLTQSQRQEWSHILTLGCVQLNRHRKEKELKILVRKLVIVCHQLKIAYDRGLIQNLLKNLYYEQFGEPIVQQFKTAGYSVENYEVWKYEDSWLTKMFNFFTD